MNYYEVLTGDVVNSASLSHAQRTELKALFDQLAGTSAGTYEYFIRGDSFQVLLRAEALREALRIKTLLHFRLSVRVRIAIGLGAVEYRREKLADSDGEAFRLSGRALDDMKVHNQLLRLSTPAHWAQAEWARAEWAIHSQVLDYLEWSRSESQSEALYWLLQHKTQQEIARQIGISQPSVHSRARAAAWPLVEVFLRRYAELGMALSTLNPTSTHDDLL
ncbi:hypothetical protein GCM10027275_11810 [Rhabdobacter roseus]|uniref:Uncharacterized protein n=1 Tax=Rhabdobacter roseus TaxID=1655419 RepID=A0A840TI02_9BACT|nr:hypothetical protein [Rhabdobacter roseus]MBB5283094.1 hypothetical protein [Rhabdobacter roseus]